VLADDVAAVADVGGARIAVVRARGPDRSLGIGRTVGRVARAGLGDVALSRGRPAHRARGDERVGGADVARAIAGFGDVARSCGRAADDPRGDLCVVGTRCTRARAGLGSIAESRRRTAERPGRDECAPRVAAGTAVALLARIDDTVPADARFRQGVRNRAGKWSARPGHQQDQESEGIEYTAHGGGPYLGGDRFWK